MKKKEKWHVDLFSRPFRMLDDTYEHRRNVLAHYGIVNLAPSLEYLSTERSQTAKNRGAERVFQTGHIFQTLCSMDVTNTNTTFQDLRFQRYERREDMFVTFYAG